jgi:hypothetical protein
LLEGRVPATVLGVEQAQVRALGVGRELEEGSVEMGSSPPLGRVLAALPASVSASS